MRFGATVAKAIAAWDTDLRVAVFGSGGLSHFAVNENFDHQVLAAIKANDMPTLGALPHTILQEGTSEVKNWLGLAGAMAQTMLAATLIDYVPCYRSEAGTGNAMAFMSWQ